MEVKESHISVEFANSFRYLFYYWQDSVLMMVVDCLPSFSAILLSKTNQTNSLVKETKMKNNFVIFPVKRELNYLHSSY